MQLPYNPAIAFLDILPREIKIYGHTKMQRWMFIATLFLIAQDEKQSWCSSMAECLNKLW